jgi:hypothetical protein
MTVWICFSDAFLRLVADKHNPDKLMVSAHRKDDLLNVVGQDAEIVKTPDGDYCWRAFLSREDFKAPVGRRIDKIEYTNFEESVEDTSLRELYVRFWDLLGGTQLPATQHGAHDRPGRI